MKLRNCALTFVQVARIVEAGCRFIIAGSYPCIVIEIRQALHVIFLTAGAAQEPVTAAAPLVRSVVRVVTAGVTLRSRCIA